MWCLVAPLQRRHHPWFTQSETTQLTESLMRKEKGKEKNSDPKDGSSKELKTTTNNDTKKSVTTRELESEMIKNIVATVCDQDETPRKVTESNQRG